jgi:hypothetical protein
LSQLIGSTGTSGSWPAMPASIPSHIAGATAGWASTLAGREEAENESK